MKLFLLLAALPCSVAFMGGLAGRMPGSGEIPFFQRQASSDTTAKPPPRVQREYNTWTWETPSHGSFRINYKVEGPENGPPILLTHG